MVEQAIERACAAYAAHVGETVFDDGMRAAISAFLSDVSVSEGMELEGEMQPWVDVDQPDYGAIFKAMSAKLVEELSND
jgi:hypothetical protein